MQNNTSFTNKTEILEHNIKKISDTIEHLKSEISNVVVGNKEAINFIIISLFCNGHILLEGVPGVAKTTIIKTIANALQLTFKRIQFTPDLLPSDLIGTLIYNQKVQDFQTKKGPIFANIVLADEINRAPAKVQSALLEAMQEHQVTIGNDTYLLDEPFFVFATQNPIEQQGTYQLPEAQLDRFMFKLYISYPNISEEKEIIRKNNIINKIRPVLSKEEIFDIQSIIKNIHVDEKIIDYIVNIIAATRNPALFNARQLEPYIQCGASPRASLAIFNSCKTLAMLKNRNFVIPDDVKAVCYPTLRHRINLSYQAQAEDMTSDLIIKKILDVVPTP